MATYLLLEDGSRLLLEDGSGLLLEQQDAVQQLYVPPAAGSDPQAERDRLRRQREEEERRRAELAALLDQVLNPARTADLLVQAMTAAVPPAAAVPTVDPAAIAAEQERARRIRADEDAFMLLA